MRIVYLGLVLQTLFLTQALAGVYEGRIQTITGETETATSRETRLIVALKGDTRSQVVCNEAGADAIEKVLITAFSADAPVMVLTKNNPNYVPNTHTAELCIYSASIKR